METDKDDLLNNFKDSTKSKSKLLNIKKIIFISLLFILFIFAFVIMIILLILQSRKINDLNNLINKLDNHINKLDNQIKNLTNQFDEQDILFNQNITNLNRSMEDNINNLQKSLKFKDEEIKLLKHDSNNLNNEKLLIYNDINDIKNKLIQNSKEIDICSNNFYLLNNEIKNNEIKIYRNFAEMQSLKNLESNLALLVDFKIKIKADFYINQKQAQLCSQNHYNSDRFDDSRIRLFGHVEKVAGCVWIVHQNGKFFEFISTNSEYGMNNWKIEIKNDNAFVTNKEKGSIFILETVSLYKYYKIKDKETGQYLFINTNKYRDQKSYYIDLTINEDMATDFYFEIYYYE